MKKLQMIALAAALSVTGAHAGSMVMESKIEPPSTSWTQGFTITYLGKTYYVMAIVAGVATLAVVAAHNGGSSGTTGTIQVVVPSNN